MAVKDSNQVEFFMQNKRVPGNHNLTLWTEPQFRGYPINPNYSLVTQYLEKLHRVINGSIQGYPRTFAVLVELHCDRPTRELSDSNRVMQAFKERVRCKNSELPETAGSAWSARISCKSEMGVGKGTERLSCAALPRAAVVQQRCVLRTRRL